MNEKDDITKWTAFCGQRKRRLCSMSQKFSLSSKCCILSFGLFPGVLIAYADVSEHSLFHLHRRCEQEEDEGGKNRVFQNVCTYNSEAGVLRKRYNTKLTNQQEQFHPGYSSCLHHL
jgi:hypothetical protein